MTSIGEANGAAKKTEKDVRAMRLLHRRRIYTNVELCALFQVSRSTLQKILARKIWASVK